MDNKELDALEELAARIKEANCRPMEVSTLAAPAILELIALARAGSAAPTGQQAEPVAYLTEPEIATLIRRNTRHEGDDSDLISLCQEVEAEVRKRAQKEGASEQDAARYRFLRAHWVSFSAAPPLSNLHWKGDKLDAKIDAAMSAAQAQPKDTTDITKGQA